MKKLISLLALSLVSFNLFAATEITLVCDHESEDKWALQGKTQMVDLEINSSGNILSGAYEGIAYEGWTANSGSTYLVIPPDLTDVPWHSKDHYGNFYLIFESNELKSLKEGKTILGHAQNNGYLAYFEEEISCLRIR